MVVVSRAPFAKLVEYQKRMGWTFKWVSSGGSDFNFDFQASFTPEEMTAKRAFYNFTMRDPKAREREGHSIFYKDEQGQVFHTYSCYDRATTSSIFTITIWISCRKGATRRAWTVLGPATRRVLATNNLQLTTSN